MLVPWSCVQADQEFQTAYVEDMSFTNLCKRRFIFPTMHCSSGMFCRLLVMKYPSMQDPGCKTGMSSSKLYYVLSQTIHITLVQNILMEN